MTRLTIRSAVDWARPPLRWCRGVGDACLIWILRSLAGADAVADRMDDNVAMRSAFWRSMLASAGGRSQSLELFNDEAPPRPARPTFGVTLLRLLRVLG